MLTEVADGVWIRQSEWVWSNTTVVRGDDGLVLVDPGISGQDLEELADDLDRLGMPVVAGFSTHPHWDHWLWHPRYGDVPRFATGPNVELAGIARERAQGMAADSAEGIPLELIGLLTPLPEGDVPLRGELVVHDAHAVGHAAVRLADRGVLIAGDLFSDILIPILDNRQSDQVSAFESALERLSAAAEGVDVLIPGHGAVAAGAEVAQRIAADRAYIDALRQGADSTDPRLDQDWVAAVHQGNVEHARRG